MEAKRKLKHTDIQRIALWRTIPKVEMYNGRGKKELAECASPSVASHQTSIDFLQCFINNVPNSVQADC